MSAISLRLPDSIHRKIKELAERDHTWRGQRQRFLQLLAKAPAVEADESDRLPAGAQRVSEAPQSKSPKSGPKRPVRKR